jgi:hypothetical protein
MYWQVDVSKLGVDLMYNLKDFIRGFTIPVTAPLGVPLSDSSMNRA